MAENVWIAVDDYIGERLVGEDEALHEVAKASDTAGLPAIAVAPNQGKLLHLYAKMIGAKRVLEIGTLGGYSTIWLARALPDDGLPALEAEEPFDLVFIDADKQNNPRYFRWALKLTKPGSVIVVDNVVRGGAVADATRDSSDVVGTRELYDMVGADPRVTATAVQTVGLKGYDGFLIARVN